MKIQNPGLIWNGDERERKKDLKARMTVMVTWIAAIFILFTVIANILEGA